MAAQLLTASPEHPSYYPLLKGLELGGGPQPRRLGFTQLDMTDWSGHELAQHCYGRPVDYVIGDARALPWPDGEFDAIFASNLLEHFSNTTEVLTEWARVIRPYGALELIVPDAMGILRDFFTGTMNWEDTAERILGSRSYEGNEHFACFTKAEFPAVIAEVESLELVSLLSSHSGGGIHVVAAKLP